MSSPVSSIAEVDRSIRPGSLNAALEDMPCVVQKILVPGWTQFHWGQSERGFVFMGSYLSSLGTALFCWGSWLGWAFLALGAGWLVASTMDVVRQRVFPVFPSRVAYSAVLLVVCLVFGVPLVASLLSYAWPSETDRVSGAAYLVNRRAYVANVPVQGQWVWIRSSPSRTPRSGQIVAVAGQEVECTGRRWRVDGKEVRLPFPGPETDFPARWKFRVPKDHVLLGPEGRGMKSQSSSPLVIVAQDQIVGRAWARYYPLWERSLL